jgi:hypothetical protein
MKIRIVDESHLYDLIKSKIIPDLEPSEVQMSRYDCYSIEHNIDVELKCRKKHYDDLLIEKKKYDALIDRAKKHGTNPVYINSTPVGIWAFRLLEIDEPVWEERGMPKTSEFRQRHFVTKVVGYYNIYLGSDITSLLIS